MNKTSAALRGWPVGGPIAARFVGGLNARATAPTAAAAGVQRHLVLAYRPDWQSLDDLRKIARHVADLDPTIRTFIVPATHLNGVTRRDAAIRPTLVVSPGKLWAFRPLRGKVYEGRPIPKIEELWRLANAGVPVPRFALLTPELRLDPDEWGEFVILKPTDITTSSHGLGIQLMRTRRVRYLAPGDYPPDHPGRLGPMIVQRYVPSTGVYRVMIFMGEVLSAYALHLPSAIDLDVADDVLERTNVATQAAGELRRTFVRDPDVLALARAADRALPEIPLKGCDLIRDTRTGELFVLEVNPGGNTWHFSSRHFAATRQKLGLEFQLSVLQQFDALRTAAKALVARTNAEAE